MQNPRHIKLGIQVPAEELAQIDPSKILVSSHVDVARWTKSTNRKVFSLIELQGFYLLTQLSFAFVSMRKFRSKFPDTGKDNANIVIQDLYIILGSESWIDVDDENFFNNQILAFGILKDFDHFAARHKENFSELEGEVMEHMNFIESLNQRKISQRAVSLYRTMYKLRPLRVICESVIPKIYKGDMEGAARDIGYVKEIGSLDLNVIDAYLRTLERKELEAGN